MAEAGNAQHNRQQLEKMARCLQRLVSAAEHQESWGEFGVLFQTRQGKITMIREKAERTETT